MTFPQFEFFGPKCKDNDCSGTLISSFNLKYKIGYLHCSKCNLSFYDGDNQEFKLYLENLNKTRIIK